MGRGRYVYRVSGRRGASPRQCRFCRRGSSIISPLTALYGLSPVAAAAHSSKEESCWKFTNVVLWWTAGLRIAKWDWNCLEILLTHFLNVSWKQSHYKLRLDAKFESFYLNVVPVLCILIFNLVVSSKIYIRSNLKSYQSNEHVIMSKEVIHFWLSLYRERKLSCKVLLEFSHTAYQGEKLLYLFHSRNI